MFQDIPPPAGATLSRRRFGQLAALLGAGLGTPLIGEPALAQQAAAGITMKSPDDMVFISQNTSPIGPCAEAIEASNAITPLLCRYQPRGEREALIKAASAHYGIGEEFITPWAGSSDPLYRIAVLYTSPTRGLVVPDPTFEVAGQAAELGGAKVRKVPLKADLSHDVKAMLAADPKAGIYYICNPNNPTGTLTPKEDIEWLLNNKPAGSILLIDEAYLDFSNAESCASFVTAGKDVIILKTFSKIFGMAGMRMGLTFGRPDLVKKLLPYGYPGTRFLPMNAVVAATASLKAPGLVPTRKKAMADVRNETFAFLKSKGLSYSASDANFFMLEVNRPGKEFTAAMAKENILVGRAWSIWPTKVRVTIGSADDMRKFQAALVKVMA